MHLLRVSVCVSRALVNIVKHRTKTICEAGVLDPLLTEKLPTASSTNSTGLERQSNPACGGQNSSSQYPLYLNMSITHTISVYPVNDLNILEKALPQTLNQIQLCTFYQEKTNTSENRK